jgi:hypothetical protein
MTSVGADNGAWAGLLYTLTRSPAIGWLSYGSVQ